MILVAANDTTSGPTKGIIQFIKSVQSSECSLHLFNFQLKDDKRAESFKRAMLLNQINANFLNQGRYAYLRVLRQASREVREKSINIVQTHGFKPSIIGLYLKLTSKIKWICFHHGDTAENLKIQLYQILDKLSQPFADRLVLVSEAQKQRVLRCCDADRIRVIHNAVDLHRPVSFSTEGKFALQNIIGHDHPRLVSYIGRLSPEKGVDILIKAIPYIEDPNVHILIVGNGQEHSNLLHLASKIGVMDRVHFLGHTTTPGNYIQASDIITLPSRSEGIPNIALEAMALGKPVVATCVGGTPEVIEDGLSGILVPPENPKALANAISSLLQDPQLSTHLGLTAVARVQKHFSPIQRTRRILDIYKELLTS